MILENVTLKTRLNLPLNSFTPVTRYEISSLNQCTFSNKYSNIYVIWLDNTLFNLDMSYA